MMLKIRKWCFQRNIIKKSPKWCLCKLLWVIYNDNCSGPCSQCPYGIDKDPCMLLELIGKLGG